MKKRRSGRPAANYKGALHVKSTVEKLSPTRVRINVEVPFAELEPDFSKAYN